MQLFAGDTAQFTEKALSNEIGVTLKESFANHLGYRPSESEVHSWTASLFHLAFSLDRIRLRDGGILVEYRLPLSSRRLDAMITGGGADGRERAAIVELKQWDRAWRSGIDDTVSFDRSGRGALHLHPSRQAGNYAEYLKGHHTAFYDAQGRVALDLRACSYLHNAHSGDCGDLLHDEYAQTVGSWPMFTGDRRQALEEWLDEGVGRHDGRPALKRVLESKVLPSRRLLDHAAQMIEGDPVFTLLDEQQIAFNIVRTKVREFGNSGRKAVVLVVGGPGTGKSVIAVRLLADLAREGRSVSHCTGSKAFTTNLRARVGKEAASLFRYFNNFVDVEPGTLDVLVADEAHRVRATSNSRFQKRSTKSQVQELLDAGKVSIFLLDDNQVVRPNEVGTPELIRSASVQTGAEYFEIHLDAQFRCSGSEAYLRWLDHFLGLDGEPDRSWLEDYEFAICESPGDLEGRIREKAGSGHTARLVAGFCWPWSDPRPDGGLESDVGIGEWRRPWNRKERGGEPPHRHPYTIWATQASGLDEVGCIYSAQGFEFDYCGVIFGPDLVRRGGGWTAVKERSCDTPVKRSKELARNLRNTYRVLMSRGIRGTYVYFLDPETREFCSRTLAGP